MIVYELAGMWLAGVAFGASGTLALVQAARRRAARRRAARRRR